MTQLRGLLHAVDITREVKDSVERLVAHLGAHRVVVGDGWQPIAAACGLVSDELPDEVSVSTVPLLVVGPVDEHVANAPGARFGFVALGAVRRKVWQREPTRFEEPTMTLWRAGWSPIIVDRIEVAATEATVEIVVGMARPTPPPVVDA